MHYDRFKFLVLCIFMKAILLIPSYSNAETIVLSSYHQAPPFVTGEASGLTYDLVNYMMNQPQISVFEVEVHLMPRKRLDKIIGRENIIVPWVTHAWFKGEGANTFNWSPPVLKDGSIYIWRSNQNYVFKKPSDLVGYRLGGVIGYRYKNIDSLVSANKIIRDNSNSEYLLLKKLLFGRIDVGIIPYSSGRHLIKINNWEFDFNQSMHDKFSRRFLINHSNAKVNKFINTLSLRMNSDPQWKIILAKYGLSLDK